MTLENCGKIEFDKLFVFGCLELFGSASPTTDEEEEGEEYCEDEPENEDAIPE